MLLFCCVCFFSYNALVPPSLRPYCCRETFHLPDDLTEEEKLEPVKNATADPRIRLLNRLYAKKRKVGLLYSCSITGCEFIVSLKLAVYCSSPKQLPAVPSDTNWQCLLA